LRWFLTMSFDIKRIHKSSRRVMKFLRNNSKRPSPDAIHDLRTSTRSLETTFTTLGLDSKGNVKRLLRDLRYVRKGAGKVRDMDVLTANVLRVKQHGEQDCLVRLLEYLGAERNRYARKLRRVIETNTPKLRRNLKRNSKRVERILEEAINNPAGSDATSATMAKAIRIASDLNSPAHLKRDNLHPYRLKVKELRNVLQLSDRAGGEAFVETLGEVKDAVGDWHDWEELIRVASQVLNHCTSCKLIRRLKAISNARYENALSLTSRLRSHYLMARTQKNGTRPARRSLLSNPVLRATSAIAEP
jgi:CHAD domain-containing protein